MAEEAPKKQTPSALKSFIAGGCGGVCLVITGQPLDTIKVRVQTSTQYSGALDCFKKTVAKEGFFGLYKGMTTPLVGITPIYAICFFGFGVGQKMQQKDPKVPLTIAQTFNAGLVAGLMTTVIMAPGERIKCLLQMQTDPKNQKYKGAMDCARQILKEEGFTRGLYRGTCATMLRDVPASGAYFAGYELILRQLSPTEEGRAQLSPGKTLLAGGTAGMLNWAVAIAPDTLKSRFQTAPPGQYTGVRDVFVQMVRNEGILALFKGLAPVMLRAFPANAACFLGYETSMSFMNKAAPSW